MGAPDSVAVIYVPTPDLLSFAKRAAQRSVDVANVLDTKLPHPVTAIREATRLDYQTIRNRTAPAIVRLNTVPALTSNEDLETIVTAQHGLYMALPNGVQLDFTFRRPGDLKIEDGTRD